MNHLPPLVYTTIQIENIYKLNKNILYIHMKCSPPQRPYDKLLPNHNIYIYIYIYKTKIKKTNLPPTIAACNQNISENSTQTPRSTYPPNKKKKLTQICSTTSPAPIVWLCFLSVFLLLQSKLFLPRYSEGTR